MTAPRRHFRVWHDGKSWCARRFDQLPDCCCTGITADAAIRNADFASLEAIRIADEVRAKAGWAHERPKYYDKSLLPPEPEIVSNIACRQCSRPGHIMSDGEPEKLGWLTDEGGTWICPGCVIEAEIGGTP